jgi:hypothetical protein
MILSEIEINLSKYNQKPINSDEIINMIENQKKNILELYN